MSCANYVGRVGALAVALGIGTAVITSPGIAWADDDTTDTVKTPTANDDTTANTATHEVATPDTHVGTTPVTHDDPKDTKDTKDEQSGGSTTITVGGGPEVILNAQTTTGSSGSTTASTPSTPTTAPALLPNTTPVVEVAPVVPTTPVAPTTPVEPLAVVPSNPEPKPNPNPVLAQSNPTTPTPPENLGPVEGSTGADLGQTFSTFSRSAGARSFAVTALAADPPAPTVVNPNAVTSTPVSTIPDPLTLVTILPGNLISYATHLVAAVLAPFLAPGLIPGPAVPADTPVLWAVLAFVRRQFFNTSPTLSPYGAQISTGQVVGNVGAADVDGDAVYFQVLNGPANGAVTLSPNGDFVYTPNVGYLGGDDFTVAVSDDTNPHVHGPLESLFTIGGGHLAATTVHVAVGNIAPVATDDDYTLAEDTPLSVTAANGVLANDTDVNAQPLSAALGTGPTKGNVVLATDGSFTYTPNLNANGTDTFTYTVSDGTLTDTGTVTLNITPVNDPPVAAPDGPITVVEDTPLTVPIADLVAAVLANDTDPDIATNGDTLTLTGYTQPTNGTLAVDPTAGTITYTPNPDYTGDDAFTYTITDTAGATSTATVTLTITPVNDAPDAVDDPLTTAEDTPLLINPADLLGNDTDVDGDTLSIVAVNPPANGTFTPNGDGTVTYTPDPGFTGEDTFTYTVSDGTLTDTATVTITVTAGPVNTPPVAVDDALSTAEDTPVSVATLSNLGILLNDTDVDGTVVNGVVVTGPSNGTLVFVGNGTNYVPNPNFTGTDSFTYRALDNDGTYSTNTATVTITITPVNDAPVAVDDDDLTTAEDTPLPFTSADLTGNDTDPDLPYGDTLTVTAIDTTSTHGGTIADHGDGTFTYTPAADYNGTDTFGYTIRDTAGLTSTATVSVTVTAVNDAPVASADDLITAEDTPLPITSADLVGNDTDPDLPYGDTLTVTAVDTTSTHGGTIADNGDGTFTYTPASNYNGTDTFGYTIRDTAGLTSTATVSFTVTAVNDAPVASADIATVTQNAGPTVIDVLANDTDPDLTYGDILTITDPGTTTNGGTVTTDGVTITYTPGASTTGTDTFTYTITDSAGATSQATVTVTVNAPPSGVITTVTVGTLPRGVVLVGTRAYVTNQSSGTVSVVDTTTNTVIGSPIAVGNTPIGTTVNPAGTRLYVANTGSGTVSVIDTTTNTVIGSPIAVGSQPLGIVSSPAGNRVYVANLSSNNVSIIDTSGPTPLVTNVAVGSTPTGVAVTPNGARVYVTNQGSDTVSVIDTATNTVLGSPIPVGDSPFGIAVSPNGAKVYVVNRYGGTVSVIDTATNTVVGAPIPIGSEALNVAFSPDGSRAYVTNAGGGTVVVIDTATNAPVGSPIAVPGRPSEIAVSADGTRLYVSNQSTGLVVISV